MSIGKVARLTGATPKEIRLYEARGLIPVPDRKNGYRLYSDLHVFLIHMIRIAQSAGFTQSEPAPIMTRTARGARVPLELAEAFYPGRPAIRLSKARRLLRCGAVRPIRGS